MPLIEIGIFGGFDGNTILRAVCTERAIMLRGLTASVAIESVQDLLDHKRITITQIYDKQRGSVRDSASHKVPI